MGLFKDMKNLKDQTKGYKRPGLRDSIHAASASHAIRASSQSGVAKSMLGSPNDETRMTNQ